MTTPVALPKAQDGILAAATLSRLARFFETNGHRPSGRSVGSTGDLARTLEAMAEGRQCPSSSCRRLIQG